MRTRYRKYISKQNTSATVAAVLTYVYRKEELFSQCGRYGERVIDGLVELGLVKKVSSNKGIFYFKTEKSETFKALDFAKEFLWAFHNTPERIINHGKKYILCFDESLPNGRDLVEIEEAIIKHYL
jgi:hypothetical protein